MATKTTAGIDLLRLVTSWADWQREHHWLPVDGKNPTLAQIVELYTLCMTWDVETPEDLAMHDDLKARASWVAWVAARGAANGPTISW